MGARDAGVLGPFTDAAVGTDDGGTIVREDVCDKLRQLLAGNKLIGNVNQ